MAYLRPMAWHRQPRRNQSHPWYLSRSANPVVEIGYMKEVIPDVDIEDEELQNKIRGFNKLVHEHRVAPAQTFPSASRRAKLGDLAEAAKRELGIKDIKRFMKHKVWPFVKQGGDLACVGFHYLKDFIPAHISHADVEAAALPAGYAWEDNDPKHQQNREVCTHGATLLDREQLKPAECAALPLPDLISSEIVPGLQRKLRQLALPAEMDFLYVNRYRHSKCGYIRFHHDQLTKMGPVVVGVSLGATAHLTLVRTCTADTKLPGKDGFVDVELVAGSMYIMSGISRYGLKHGVLDASALGDRVSLTFREITKPTHLKALQRWRRKPQEIMGALVKHPAALGCKCCKSAKCMTPCLHLSSSVGQKRRRAGSDDDGSARQRARKLFAFAEGNASDDDSASTLPSDSDDDSVLPSDSDVESPRDRQDGNASDSSMPSDSDDDETPPAPKAAFRNAATTLVGTQGDFHERVTLVRAEAAKRKEETATDSGSDSSLPSDSDDDRPAKEKRVFSLR